MMSLITDYTDPFGICVKTHSSHSQLAAVDSQGLEERIGSAEIAMMKLYGGG